MREAFENAEDLAGAIAFQPMLVKHFLLHWLNDCVMNRILSWNTANIEN